MEYQSRWLTQAGTRTDENQDGFLKLHSEHAELYLITDGASSRPGSGELARELATFIRARAACGGSLTRDSVLAILKDGRSLICGNYPLAAVSYLVLGVTGEDVIAVHEGDCCLGAIDGSGTINWLTWPHCVANWRHDRTHAELASDLDRHRLTRSFSARRSHDPEVNRFSRSVGPRLLLATDGYWADLTPGQQQRFLLAGKVDESITSDDISCLELVRTGA